MPQYMREALGTSKGLIPFGAGGDVDPVGLCVEIRYAVEDRDQLFMDLEHVLQSAQTGNYMRQCGSLLTQGSLGPNQDSVFRACAEAITARPEAHYVQEAGLRVCMCHELLAAKVQSYFRLQGAEGQT